MTDPSNLAYGSVYNGGICYTDAEPLVLTTSHDPTLVFRQIRAIRVDAGCEVDSIATPTCVYLHNAI